MTYIDFKKNWNYKLNCNYFTTIRQHSNIYREGMDVEIRLNGKPIFWATIDNIEEQPLGELPVHTVKTDTGYGYDQSIEMFRRFLKKDTVEAALKTGISLICLHKTK